MRRPSSRTNLASGTLTAEYSASMRKERKAAFIIAGDGERETSLPITQYLSFMVSGDHAPERSSSS